MRFSIGCFAVDTVQSITLQCIRVGGASRMDHAENEDDDGQKDKEHKEECLLCKFKAFGPKVRLGFSRMRRTRSRECW